MRDGQQRFSHLLDAVPDAIVGVVPYDRIEPRLRHALGEHIDGADGP